MALLESVDFSMCVYMQCHMTTFLHPSGTYICQMPGHRLFGLAKGTLRSLGFPSYHWVWVKLFLVGYVQDIGRVPYKHEKCCFRILLCPRYKIPEFFMTAPVLTSEIVVICHLHIGLMVHYKYYRKSHFGSAWSRPCTDRGLKSAHKCILYNNRCVQNFIQISWDLVVRGPIMFLSENRQA